MKKEIFESLIRFNSIPANGASLSHGGNYQDADGKIYGYFNDVREKYIISNDGFVYTSYLGHDNTLHLEYAEMMSPARITEEHLVFLENYFLKNNDIKNAQDILTFRFLQKAHRDDVTLTAYAYYILFKNGFAILDSFDFKADEIEKTFYNLSMEADMETMREFMDKKTFKSFLEKDERVVRYHTGETLKDLCNRISDFCYNAYGSRCCNNGDLARELCKTMLKFGCCPVPLNSYEDEHLEFTAHSNIEE